MNSKTKGRNLLWSTERMKYVVIYDSEVQAFHVYGKYNYGKWFRVHTTKRVSTIYKDFLKRRNWFSASRCLNWKD